MKKSIIIFILALIFMVSIETPAQVSFQATVANQNVVGSTISFDVYLTRTGTNDNFLGNADFVLYYNNANFTAPTFEYVDESNTLKNSNGTSTTSYNENIVTDPSFLAAGQLVINVQQPAFSNQTQFNSRIAKIDNTPNTHKLGTFIVTGISNPTGSFGILWKTALPGVFSNAQTLTNVDPWVSSGATGDFQNPADVLLPVELTTFIALVDRRDVHLRWSTSSEVNNSGFEIERKAEGSETWSGIEFIQGNGTTNEIMNYSFTDRGLITSKYNYRLKQIDYNGNFEYFNLSGEVILGVPEKYDLSQNYPNPFNPVTKINFDLPFDSKVTMKIFDITGREIATLVNEIQTAGYYTVTFDARNIASGMYFYRIIAEGGNQQYVMTKKMVVVK